MAAPARTIQQRYWTLAEFLDTDFSPQYGELPVELIDGLIVVDQAAPSHTHARLTAEIGRAIGNAIERCGATCFTESGSDIQIEGRFFGLKRDFVLIPDLQVRCGSDAAGDGEPSLVVEVLSPSNTGKEILLKLRAYMVLTTIRDILFVHQDLMLVQHHRRNGDGTWTGPISLEGSDAVLSIERLGLEMPLAVLYRNITLKPDEPVSPELS